VNVGVIGHLDPDQESRAELRLYWKGRLWGGRRFWNISQL